MLAARTIEILRTERGLGQRQLAARFGPSYVQHDAVPH